MLKHQFVAPAKPVQSRSPRSGLTLRSTGEPTAGRATAGENYSFRAAGCCSQVSSNVRPHTKSVVAWAVANSTPVAGTRLGTGRTGHVGGFAGISEIVSASRIGAESQQTMLRGQPRRSRLMALTESSDTAHSHQRTSRSSLRSWKDDGGSGSAHVRWRSREVTFSGRAC